MKVGSLVRSIYSDAQLGVVIESDDKTCKVKMMCSLNIVRFMLKDLEVLSD